MLEPRSCEGDLESAHFQEKPIFGVVKVALNMVCQMQRLCLPVMLVSMCTHIHPFAHLSVYPHICPSIHPHTHIHISIYVLLCIHLSIYTSMHPCICPTLYPFMTHASIHPSMLFMHPSPIIFYFGFSFVSGTGPGPVLGALTREDLVAMGGGSDTA